jgi:hypothetical protein
MEILNYGVFRLGQIWFVVGEDGGKRGFINRSDAVEAAHAMAGMHRSLGMPAQVVMQDELGLLTTVTVAGG